MGIENFYADTVLIKRPTNTPSSTGAQTADHAVVAQNISCRIRELSNDEQVSRGIDAEVSTHRMLCAVGTNIQVRDQVWLVNSSTEDPYYRVTVKSPKRTMTEVHHLELDLIKVVS